MRELASEVERISMLRRIIPFAVAALCTPVSADGQVPGDLGKRLTDLQEIEIKPGLTTIPNAEGDGRDAQVFHAWRTSGNAWGHGIYITTMPMKAQPGAGTDWLIVGIRVNATQTDYSVVSSPHNGVHDLISVRFAHGTLDDKPGTFLITGHRKPKGSVAEPVPTEIRLYALRNKEMTDAVGWPDVFEPVITFTTPDKFSDADEALAKELGLDRR